MKVETVNNFEGILTYLKVCRSMQKKFIGTKSI
jgi:hypothetical protein